MGSSPLTRGKRATEVAQSALCRLIPAHAGKTWSLTARSAWRTAHPRSRGENLLWGLPGVPGMGSSPLTRGKPPLPIFDFTGVRLIPAHAGKTRGSSVYCVHHWAHPRSRGENLTRSVNWELRGGSSPLTRGKHFLTCAFTAQIDQILETLELAVSFGSYSVWVACATDAPQDQVRSIGLVLPSSRGAS
mgnify:CR=1 FL=1